MGDLSLFDEGNKKPSKKEIHVEKEIKVSVSESENVNKGEKYMSMHMPANVNIDCDGENHGGGYGYGMGGGFGAGLVGGLIGGGLLGRGGYNSNCAPGYGYSQITAGDMLGALEAVKSSHQTSRDIFGAQMSLHHGQLVGDFATLNRIGEAEKATIAAVAGVEKSVCDTRNDLQREILESRHINAIEHCKTREVVMLGNQRILDKMCDDEKARLRDEICQLRDKEKLVVANYGNQQIINSLGSVAATMAALQAALGNNTAA